MRIGTSILPPLPAIVMSFLIMALFFTPHFVVFFFMSTSDMFAIVRHVLIAVPRILHEIDSLAAGVVLDAIPCPVRRMLRRYMQVDRRPLHLDGRSMYNDRLLINDLRWRGSADVYAAEISRLADLE
jgi:hypothetical protein